VKNWYHQIFQDTSSDFSRHFEWSLLAHREKQNGLYLPTVRTNGGVTSNLYISPW